MLIYEGVEPEFNQEKETLEGDQAIVEAIIDDSDADLSESDFSQLISESLLSERSIIKLDKNAKKALATKKAAIVIAKENDDPMYKKLAMVYKLKKKLVANIMKKYGNKADARVRKNKASMKGSSNEAIRKVATESNVKKSNDLQK